VAETRIKYSKNMAQTEKSAEKTNIPLIALVVILALVLCGEIFYLFFYKKQTPPISVVDNSAVNEAPKISKLYKKVPDSEVTLIYDSIEQKIDSTKVPFKNGVVSEMILTEVYKSVITNIGKVDVTRTLLNNKEQKFDFLFQFSNMAEDGKKDLGFLFTNKELSKVQAFEEREGELVPIDLSKLQTGDFVRVVIETNLLGSPTDNVISFTIQKLL